MVWLIITSIISIGVAILALQNGTPTLLNFIVWEFETPLICVILGSFLAGALASSVFMMCTKMKHFVTDYKNNREIRRLNMQIDSLKSNIALLTEPTKIVEIRQSPVEQAASKAEDAEVKEAASGAGDAGAVSSPAIDEKVRVAAGTEGVK